MQSVKSPRQRLIVTAAHWINYRDAKRETRPYNEANRQRAHYALENVFRIWEQQKTHPKERDYYSECSDMALERLIKSVLRYRLEGKLT